MRALQSMIAPSHVHKESSCWLLQFCVLHIWSDALVYQLALTRLGGGTSAEVQGNSPASKDDSSLSDLLRMARILLPFLKILLPLLFLI
jgi:hypothetical protein